jgi:hypothetical protein
LFNTIQCEKSLLVSYGSLLQVSLRCSYFSLLFPEGEVKSPCHCQVWWALLWPSQLWLLMLNLANPQKSCILPGIYIYIYIYIYTCIYIWEGTLFVPYIYFIDKTSSSCGEYLCPWIARHIGTETNRHFGKNLMYFHVYSTFSKK